MRRVSRSKSLGEMLIEKGILTDQQLQEAQQTQQETTQPLREVLGDLGLVDRRILYETAAEELGVEFYDLEARDLDAAVAVLLPRDLAERYRAIPIGRGEGTIRVAMADPDDVMAGDDLRRHLQTQIEALLADPTAIERAIDRAYESAAEAGAGAPAAGGGPGTMAGVDMASLTESVRDSGILGASTDETGQEERIETGRLTDVTDEAPIIKIAKVLIQRAIQEEASDIHVEPYQSKVRVRYRIDGVLHDIMPLPKYVHAPLISRLKIMSEMNIAERRVPQDGRIHIRHAQRDYDLRVSVIPTTLGEKCVMRILDKRSIEIGLDELGLESDMLNIVHRLIQQPNGMLLSTGPTGSGKTTTQYNILTNLNSVETNIITIEDPVEYQLDGLSQVHVNRKAGLTFAVALKYFLRQDPDIILVGEIRDLETSEIAIQAALTGHLVLSTLHTNDAPSTVTRLVDMGVEPFLISSSIIASLSQRLARKICQRCKEPYQPRRDVLLGMQFDPDDPENQGVQFYRGRGCDACRGTGYRGRIGLFELMVMNEEIAELIVRRASAGQVREAAMAAGMKTLREDGMTKVLNGITTVEEVTRVVATAGAYT